MKRSWIFFINPFIVATQGSYPSAQKLANFTLNALIAAAGAVTAAAKAVSVDFFGTLVAALKPSVDAYNQLYAVWLNQKGTQKGQTGMLATLLTQLHGTVIDDWDFAVQQVFRQHTPQYGIIFPHGHTPFYSGTQDDRINAVRALSLALDNKPDLATVKASVDAFLQQLTDAYNAQKGSISGSGTDSTALDDARTAVCTALYGVLGQLMDYFKDNPIAGEKFFDMETLRNHLQTVFNHDIKGGELLLALTHTFHEDEMVRITNRGNNALKFALVHLKTDAMPDTFFSAAANSEVDTPVTALGSLKNRFLIVANDATEDGAYTIELL